MTEQSIQEFQLSVIQLVEEMRTKQPALLRSIATDVFVPAQVERQRRREDLPFAPASIGWFSPGRGRPIKSGDLFQRASGRLNEDELNDDIDGDRLFFGSTLDYAYEQDELLFQRASGARDEPGMPDGGGLMVPVEQVADDAAQAVIVWFDELWRNA